MTTWRTRQPLLLPALHGICILRDNPGSGDGSPGSFSGIISVTLHRDLRYTSAMDRFRQFYTENRDRLHGYLLRRTGSVSATADLVQETFVRYLERYRDREHTPALLFSIGRNLFIDQWRRDSRTVPLRDDLPGNRPDQEETCILREQSRKILTAMESLSDDERELLALVIGGDLNYQQIADMRGYSVANVKVKVHRARQKIRQLMQEEGHE